MSDEPPRDNHRDLPRDIRHDWQYMTFSQLKDIMDERDRFYEHRFEAIEKRQNASLTALITLSLIAVMLVIATLVVFLSGHVH
jgi:hypothetical protein